MTQRRFIYDHTGDVVRTIHLNDPNDLFGGGVIQVEQDVSDILAEVQYQRAVQAAIGHESDGIRLAALMPKPVAEQAMREGWFHDPVKMKEWLNNPENRDFRVWQGRA